MQNTTRQAGALLAVSILGAVLNAQTIASGLSAGFAVLGIVVLLALGVSSLALGVRNRAEAVAGG